MKSARREPGHSLLTHFFVVLVHLVSGSGPFVDDRTDHLVIDLDLSGGGGRGKDCQSGEFHSCKLNFCFATKEASKANIIFFNLIDVDTMKTPSN